MLVSYRGLSIHSSQEGFDAARCALTAIHFPEGRTLAADEPPADPLAPPMHSLAAAVSALLGREAAGKSGVPGTASLSANISPGERLEEEEEASPVAGQQYGQYQAAGYDPAWMLLFAVKVSEVFSVETAS